MSVVQIIFPWGVKHGLPVTGVINIPLGGKTWVTGNRRN
jgi:hypothetical protein